MRTSKAWAGALASIISVIATRVAADQFGLMPEEVAALGPAVQVLVDGAVAAAIGYLVVYWSPRNTDA